MLPDTALVVLNGVALAAVYAYSGFLARKRQGGEKLDDTKLAATVTVGLVVGLFGALAGDTITPETVAAKELQYGTIILALEKVLDLTGVLDRLRAVFKKK